MHKIRFHTQLYLVISLMAISMGVVIATVISSRESDLLKDFSLTKHVTLATEFRYIASPQIHSKNQKALTATIDQVFARHPDLVYLHITDVQGDQVVSSIEGLTPKQNLPVSEGSSLSLESFRTASNLISPSVTVTERALLQDVSYRSEMRGETGEAIFEIQQILYQKSAVLGEARLGFSQKELNEALERTRSLIIVIGCGFLLVFLFVTSFVARQLVKPLRHLTREFSKLGLVEMGHIVPGVANDSILRQLEYIHPENIHSRTHEFQNLQEAFFQMKTHLMDNWKVLEEKNQEIERFNINLEDTVTERTQALNTALKELTLRESVIQEELDVASNIQQGILPTMPLQTNGVNMVAHYQSMVKVGGDFYDVFPMKGGLLGIVMADVSGHGIPAAFVTALAKISFAEATRVHISPRDILRQVNRNLLKTVKQQAHLTAFLMVISPHYAVTYGNAAHVQAIVLRKQERRLEKWDTNGLFLGMFDGEAMANLYEEKEDQLAFGDRVFLYTDGIVEGRNLDGELFGEERLHQTLMDTLDTPLEDVKDQILKDWGQFTHGTPANDDVTFLMIEIDPAYQELLECRQRGQELLAEGKVEDAIQELETALDFKTQDPRVHRLLGKCYFKNDDLAKAIEHLQIYLKDHPGDADSLYLLAESYYHQQDFPQSAQTAQKASQLRPNFIKALLLWGRSLEKSGRSAEAKTVWTKLEQADS